ncbi:MAG: helix-turn-helix transcriptional regulator [Bryobacteraceae bacterium]|nr:helix-turn-helix transcriptional regulator [Bryobacteraceae bacterium]
MRAGKHHPIVVDHIALQRARRAAGLTLYDAARAVQVSAEAVAEREYGEKVPTARQLGLLARAYACPLETLGGDDSLLNQVRVAFG